MEKKFANLGKMLSRTQAKKIIGGLEEELGCSDGCYSEADCPYGSVCHSFICPEDNTKFIHLCFRS